MQVYMINFPDNSTYIGATKSSLSVRISNHKSKWKSGKYNIRNIYRKMTEFSGVFTYKKLKDCQSLEEMYETEIAYISLLGGSGLLNNSTGGANSSAGRKVDRSTINNSINTKLKNNKIFKIYNIKTNELLYSGKSTREASLIMGITQSSVHNIIQPNKKITNSTKYRVLTGGGLSQ